MPLPAPTDVRQADPCLIETAKELDVQDRIDFRDLLADPRTQRTWIYVSGRLPLAHPGLPRNSLFLLVRRRRRSV